MFCMSNQPATIRPFNPAIFFKAIPARPLTAEQHVEKYVAAQRIRSFLEARPGWGRKTTSVGRAWWRISFVMDYHWYQGRHLDKIILPSVKSVCPFCQ